MGMLKSKKKTPVQNELQIAEDEANMSVFKKNEKDIKSLIAPGGIDASYTNHLEIQSANTRFARSMIVAGLPRMCTFPEFLRRMYTF